jgi:hypothetical protein
LDQRTRPYGGLKQTNTRPPAQSGPQFRQDGQGPDYLNIHDANDWIRGGGKGGEGKPGFDHGYKGKK